MSNNRISESEWEVMKVVWESHPRTSQSIIEELVSKYDWAEATIKTYINRLTKKGVLGFEKSGRQYLYHPIKTQKECIKHESKTFLNRVFDGAIGMMISNFIEDANLSDNEIDKLQKMLDDKRDKK